MISVINRRKLFLSVLIALNLLLAGRLIWGGQGIFTYLDLRARHATLQQQLNSVQGRLENLSDEIIKLQNDAPYQEKAIRDRMNYVKDGEILYIFPEDETSAGVESHAEKD